MDAPGTHHASVRMVPRALGATTERPDAPPGALHENAMDVPVEKFGEPKSHADMPRARP